MAGLVYVYLARSAQPLTYARMLLMGLILSRKIDQDLVLFAADGVDPAELAEQLKEGITIRLSGIDAGKAKIHIWAPESVTILRGELLKRGA
jgi:sRNA-binding carbon storage regulator CsrA